MNSSAVLRQGNKSPREGGGATASHPRPSGLSSPSSRRHQCRGVVNRSRGAGENLDTTGVLDEIGEAGTVESRAAHHSVPHLGAGDVLPTLTILR